MSLETVVDKEMKKSYIITTAQYQAKVNNQLLDNMEAYARDNKSEIIILPTIGKNLREGEELSKRLYDYMVVTKDYNINNNIKIKDFGIRPQQINPLTGIERFTQSDKSYIIPSTKQVLKYISNSYDDIPKAILTTGAVTHPHYNTDFRIGKIAKQDHEYGFVIVEILNNKYFHLRQVKTRKNGEFEDIKGHYKNGKKVKSSGVRALIAGDIHPYDLNKIHKNVTLEQIRTFKPEDVFLHDVFNGRSISHHYKGHNIRQHEVFREQGLNLEKELKETLRVIKEYASVSKRVNIVASNHDEHLFRYVDEGRFINDKGNDLIGSQIYSGVLQGNDALSYGLSLVGDIPKNVYFISRNEGYKALGFELGHHGDLGANGGRGSPKSIEIANSKSVTAHGHSAFKIRDTYRVGTSTNLRLDYNVGYSNWTQTNGILYNIGTVQLLNTIKGNYKI